MEKIDILVKGVPGPTHNMFKGLCSMAGKTVSEGVIEAMSDWIRKTTGGGAAGQEADKQRAGKKR